METFTLPSGKSAEIAPFKGRHIREAHRIAGTETDRMTFALIAMLVKIEGQPVLMEDLDEMDGRDVLELMTKVGSNFTSPPNS